MEQEELLQAIRNLGEEVHAEASPAAPGLQDILSDLTGKVYSLGGVVRGQLTASDAAAAMFSWQNTTGRAVYVEMLILRVTAPSTGACSVSAGVAATAVSSANLIDTQSVAAAGALSNAANGGTNGKDGQLVPAGQFVTVSVASGASAGLVGSAYIKYIPVD